MPEVLARFALAEHSDTDVVIAVRSEHVEAQGFEPAARKGTIEQAGCTFDDATSIVAPVTESILGRLRRLESAPDEVVVEFGLALSIRTGAIIAATSTEGNFAVKITWKKPT